MTAVTGLGRNPRPDRSFVVGDTEPPERLRGGDQEAFDQPARRYHASMVAWRPRTRPTAPWRNKPRGTPGWTRWKASTARAGWRPRLDCSPPDRPGRRRRQAPAGSTRPAAGPTRRSPGQKMPGSAARPAGAEADRGGTARPAARAPPRGLAARRRGPDRRRSRPATPGQPGWPAGAAAPRAGAPPPGARTGGRELVSRWRGSGPASSAARRPTRSPSAWRTPCRPRDRSRLGRTWPLPALHPVLAPDTDPPSARPARPARTRCHPAPATSLPPSTGAGDPASTIRASRAGTREPVRSSQVRVVRRRFLRGG